MKAICGVAHVDFGSSRSCCPDSNGLAAPGEPCDLNLGELAAKEGGDAPWSLSCGIPRDTISTSRWMEAILLDGSRNDRVLGQAVKHIQPAHIQGITQVAEKRGGHVSLAAAPDVMLVMPNLSFRHGCDGRIKEQMADHIH